MHKKRGLFEKKNWTIHEFLAVTYRKISKNQWIPTKMPWKFHSKKQFEIFFLKILLKMFTNLRLFFDFSCVSTSGDASNFILWLFSVGDIIILYMILSLFRLNAISFKIMVYISIPCLRLIACLIVWLIQREPEALLSKKVVALKSKIRPLAQCQ